MAIASATSAPTCASRDGRARDATAGSQPAHPMPDPFSESYFRRYYEAGRSRVYGGSQIAELAKGVTGFVRWFGVHIDTVLDIGAGTGLWGKWFRKHMPDAR